MVVRITLRVVEDTLHGEAAGDTRPVVWDEVVVATVGDTMDQNHTVVEEWAAVVEEEEATAEVEVPEAMEDMEVIQATTVDITMDLLHHTIRWVDTIRAAAVITKAHHHDNSLTLGNPRIQLQ